MLRELEYSKIQLSIRGVRPLPDKSTILKADAKPYSVRVDKDILVNTGDDEVPANMSLLMGASSKAFQHIYETHVFICDEDEQQLEEAKRRVKIYSLTLMENMKSEDPTIKKSALIRAKELVNSAADTVGQKSWQKFLELEYRNRQRFQSVSSENGNNKRKHRNVLMQPSVEYSLPI